MYFLAVVQLWEKTVAYCTSQSLTFQNVRSHMQISVQTLIDEWIVNLKLNFIGVLLHLAQILNFIPSFVVKSVCSSTPFLNAIWEHMLRKKSLYN